MNFISFVKAKTSEIYYKGMIYSVISRSIHLAEIGDKHLLRLNIFDNNHVEIGEVIKIKLVNNNSMIKVYYRIKFGEANCVYNNFDFIDHIFEKTKVNLASKDFWEYIKNIRRIKCRKLI